MRNALSGNRGGNSGNPGNGYSGGNGGNSNDGGFLNALRYGGLFSENNGHGASSGNAAGNKPRVTVSGAGPGGPVQFSTYLNY